MNEEKNLSIKEALKLQLRAMKLIHSLDRSLFPIIGLANIFSSVTPFILIWFSARILNELAGKRNPDTIWRWVILTVVITGMISLLSYGLQRLEEYHRKKVRADREIPFMNKMFDMDYCDMADDKTNALRAQIRQSENWGGYGIFYSISTFESVIKSITGIISAVTLTASLFTAKVPESSERYVILNNPLFIALFLGLMLLLAFISGRLFGYVGKLKALQADGARMGNRIFGRFGFFGIFGVNSDVDTRIYKQNRIAKEYMLAYRHEGYGLWGPFIKMTRGKGGIAYATAGSLSNIFTGVVYTFTCLKALGGAFGVGLITQYVGAATTLSGNLTDLFKTISDIKTNGNFLRTCFEFLDIPNSMYQGSLTTEKRNDRKYEVEFKNVSFKYPGTDTWALRNVSMKFNVGNRVAVVGENGSGKTTFIKLLCRLYDPQEGEILLNGINIKKYNYRDYMDIFSIVFQDFQLLSQPLGNNVTGCLDYDKDRVINALTDAGFENRLNELPDGLNTLLYRDFDDNGVNISGGEAQKIAIARALYKDAPFLILDEPTAALDPIAEAEIYSQLNQIVDDRTAVYISHRLSSCRFCDEILVFDHGSIVETGSHEELVNHVNGKYNALWNAQAQYYA